MDRFRESLNNNRDILINKMMHQSHELLNTELIRSTITVLELNLKDDQEYWVIQLGALKNFQKSLEIVNKLKMYDYPVYMFPNNCTNDQCLIRIFVGPYSSKIDLESLLDNLYNLSHLRGKIYRYW